jgi:hypothetical protein
MEIIGTHALTQRALCLRGHGRSRLSGPPYRWIPSFRIFL